MRNSYNKAKVLFIGVLCGLLFIILIPKGADRVDNAIINPENGDIAFVHFDSTKSQIILTLADKNGTILFSKAVYANGGSHALIAFSGEGVCLYASRSGKYYSFSRSGESSNEYLSSKSDMESKATWDGWTKKYGKKYAEFEGTKYVYEYSSFPKYIWNDECSLYIQNEQNLIEFVYQDE